MKRYAIVEKRTKRMVGSAATIDVATAALDALGAPQTNIATMGGMSRQSADINVRFDNLPAMTRIDTTTSDTNLDLDIYRGASGGGNIAWLIFVNITAVRHSVGSRFRYAKMIMRPDAAMKRTNIPVANAP